MKPHANDIMTFRPQTTTTARDVTGRSAVVSAQNFFKCQMMEAFSGKQKKYNINKIRGIVPAFNGNYRWNFQRSGRSEQL